MEFREVFLRWEVRKMEYKGEIITILENIKEEWILQQIYEFVVNMTKED